MSTPIVRSSGSLTTNGTVTTGAGSVTYAEATGGTLILYNGSTSGDLILTVTSSGVTPLPIPVVYGSSGLYVTISAGSGVVHYT